jgi:nicotinate-nucleotide adenylyltransferase
MDRVLMVVANVPWQKADARAVSSAEDRLALVEAAVGWRAGVEASRLEIDRGGESYTADTLASCAALYPTTSCS